MQICHLEKGLQLHSTATNIKNTTTKVCHPTNRTGLTEFSITFAIKGLSDSLGTIIIYYFSLNIC